MEDGHQAKEGSLAEEIVAKEPYVRAYICLLYTSLSFV